MPNVQIMINKLTANYSSNCHCKIKIVLNSSPNKESAENKHSFKYEKGNSEVNIYEQLVLNLSSPLTIESKLHFFLLVYTKNGYKTAGIGKFNLSEGIMINVPQKIEIQKCPLGKGYLEFQFLNNDSNKNPVPTKTLNKIALPQQITKDNISNYSDNSFISNITNNLAQNPCDISEISYGTNITTPITINNNKNNNQNKSTDNMFKKIKKFNSNNNITNNFNNNNIYNIQNTNPNIDSNSNIDKEILKEKDKQINELKTKLNYYEDENNELKNLINDFKKEKKAISDEKNMLLRQQNEKLQKAVNEKEDLQMKYMSLKQNLNVLQNSKNDSDQKVLNIKAQTDKQIKDLIQQVKNLNNIKLQLENENREKEEKIYGLDKKIKEININYQKKLSELNNNYSSEKNSNYLKYNENLRSKEEEVAKLKIKIRSLEENVQSLNELMELNNRQREEKNEMTENMTKLLEQISSKDKTIYELKKEVAELNNKISIEEDNKKTKYLLNDITEKDLKKKINDLQNIINEKNNEINDWKIKYDNLRNDSKRFQPKIHYIEESDDDEPNNKNNEILLNQIKEIQKTYKEREEKIIKEKDEEIKKLRNKNKDLIRESYLDNFNNNIIDIKKYVSEINRLKNINNNLEEDLHYYKDLNNKYVEKEKRATIYENENVKLQNLVKQKNDKINLMKKKNKKLQEDYDVLEKQLISSKGKLGEVLNELVEVESKYASVDKDEEISNSFLTGAKKLLNL